MRVKALIEKATQAFVSKNLVLSDLRNWHDYACSSKRPAFRKAIKSLKEQCRELWALLGGLCEQGSGEHDFLLRIQRMLCKASEEGSQAARRRELIQSQRQEGMTALEPGECLEGEPASNEGAVAMDPQVLAMEAGDVAAEEIRKPAGSQSVSAIGVRAG